MGWENIGIRSIFAIFWEATGKILVLVVSYKLIEIYEPQRRRFPVIRRFFPGFSQFTAPRGAGVTRIIEKNNEKNTHATHRVFQHQVKLFGGFV